MTSAISKKELFDKLKAKYTNDLGEPIIQDSYLRIEQTLTTGISFYKFNLVPTPGTDLSVESKLDQNDVFVITEIGVFIYEQTTAKIGREVLQTYPNVAGFGAVTAANVPDLECVYNGYLQISVGNTVYLPNWDLKKHRLVPTAQQGNINAAIAGPVTYTTNSTEFNGVETGWQGLSNPISVSGQGTNNIGIYLPLWAAAVLTHNNAANKNQVVFYPRGFVVKNRAYRTNGK